MPIPQPYLVPVYWRRSRRTQSMGISPSASRVRGWPLTSIVNGGIGDLSARFATGRKEIQRSAGKGWDGAGKPERVSASNDAPPRSGAGCGEEVLPAGLAHAQAAPAFQNDGTFALAFANDLPHTRDIDNGGSMHAREPRRIEGGRKLLDRFPEQVGFASHMQAGIIIGGLDPFDVFDRDQHIASA